MKTDGLKGWRVILIGGTSHTGKSTLAQALAARLGWEWRSTDRLARHPGRPWAVSPKTVPEHVAEHYLSLSIDELVADVMRHYRDNVWPLARSVMDERVASPGGGGLVFEGSALWPEMVASLAMDRVAAIWLTADDVLIRERIWRESGYVTKSVQEQEMIDRFLGRTLRYQAQMREAVKRLGLAAVEVEDAASSDALVDACLAELGRCGGR